MKPFLSSDQCLGVDFEEYPVRICEDGLCDYLHLVPGTSHFSTTRAPI